MPLSSDTVARHIDLIVAQIKQIMLLKLSECSCFSRALDRMDFVSVTQLNCCEHCINNRGILHNLLVTVIHLSCKTT